MIAVVQRVDRASVTADGQAAGAIERGFLVLLGVKKGDSEAEARLIADKVCGLRVFEDENERMNLSLADVGGSILAVSQFTLLADCSHGRRPSFFDAEEPRRADELYRHFVELCRGQGIAVETGVFGAHMLVDLVNNGPVTIILDTEKLMRREK